MQCKELKNPIDGEVIVDGSQIGRLALYKCHKNFELIGNRNRQCLNNQKWSGIDPICKGKNKHQKILWLYYIYTEVQLCWW